MVSTSSEMPRPPVRPGWQPRLEPELRERALRMARETAERLREPGRLEQAAAAAVTQSSYPEVVRWRAPSTFGGDAGMAIVAASLDAGFPGTGWDTVGHRHLLRAKQAVEEHPHPPLGLSGGIAGIAFSAWALSRGGTRYRKLLTALDAWLLPRAEAAARQMEQAPSGLPTHAFDAISGLSGVAAYLLCRRETPEAERCLRRVLEALASLARPEGPVPRWSTSAEQMREEDRALYPHGNLNCGLAHGIPGPLAAMALGLGAGMEVEGLREATEQLASWLAAQRIEDEWGVNWPNAIPLPAPDAAPGPPPVCRPARAAWCYGSPGIARALWLAGVALERAPYRELAVSALEAVHRRPASVRYIDSPTFCHGIAGLLHITLRFAQDTGLPAFTEAAATLTLQLLARHDPERPLGFYSLEPGGRVVDDPGLLDGAASVPLVLLAAATEHPPVWDRLFLLS